MAKLRPIVRGGQTARANVAQRTAASARAFASTVAPPAQPQVGGGAIQKIGEEFVRMYSTTSRGVPVSANRRWDNPISYEETGYILSWMIAVNDPQMKVTFKIEGEDRTEIILHDHTMEQTASLGLGMTYGEFYSTNPVGGGTSRDIRGSKHSTRPFLARAKTTFTGIETNYDLIKGTADDKWIVLQFDPELPRKYYALTLDVENTLGEGDRMIHEIFVDRMVVISQFATQVAHKQYAPRLVDSSLVETEKVKAYAGSLVNPLDEDAVGEPVEPSIDFSAGVPHLSPAPAEDLEEEEEEENGEEKEDEEEE